MLIDFVTIYRLVDEGLQYRDGTDPPEVLCELRDASGERGQADFGRCLYGILSYLSDHAGRLPGQSGSKYVPDRKRHVPCTARPSRAAGCEYEAFATGPGMDRDGPSL